jgi:uncharacterized protein YbbC (DUF1343 family)
VSVGRGTETPFEVVGAPWIDGKALAAQLSARGLAGVRFEATSFTPSESAYAGQTCGGIRLTITDRNLLDTPLLGVELMGALYRLYGDQFQVGRTLGMIGSRSSLDAVKARTDPREIARSWTPGLEDFRARREPHLLY